MTRPDDAPLGCDRCAHLCAETRMTTPERLGAFVAARQADVCAGALVQIGDPTSLYHDPFLNLSTGPVWANDGFWIRLACSACRQPFAFGALTYRGPGGEWTPVPVSAPTSYHGVHLELARTAVLAGAEAIRPFMRASRSAEAKADGSPVTAADLAADRAIADVLAPSGFPILSEESGLASGADSIYTWVVDPLDGTKAFVAGRDEFTVNVALVARGQGAVLGAVHVPASDVTYCGEGLHAWKETPGDLRRRIGVRDLAPDHVTILTSRSYRGPDIARLVAAATAEGIEARTVPMSSSLKMCRVAEGAADLYPRPGPTNAWDTAAAQAVLEAAGGFLGTWDGARLGVDVKAPLNPPVVAWGGRGMAEAWARWSSR